MPAATARSASSCSRPDQALEILLAQDDPYPDRVAGHGPDRLDLRRGGALGRRGRGCLQPEHQRAREAAGVRAVEHAAGVRPGGEQAGDHAARIRRARAPGDRSCSPLNVNVIAGMTSIT